MQTLDIEQLKTLVTVADAGKFSVAADVQEGKGRVIITALSKDDEFLNYLLCAAL